MKCFYHLDRDAVSTCQVCGKFLCPECTTKYSPIVCEDCYRKAEEAKRKEAEELELAKEKAFKRERTSLIVRFVIGIAFFVGVYIWSWEEWWSIFFFFIPYGWTNIFSTKGLSEEELTRREIRMLSVRAEGIGGFFYYFLWAVILCVVTCIPYFFIRNIRFIKHSRERKKAQSL